MESRACADRERRGIRIRGVVQGVGFRPAIHRLADRLGLAGFVKNDRGGVWLELEGPAAALDRFLVMLEQNPPPAARIDTIELATISARLDEGFHIAPSAAEREPGGGADIPADLAPCDACLRELADPEDRRHRYAFINCTACGPRFSIVREVPYDRSRTTMDVFAMCDSCLREYEDPLDRRFHAEPIACPACGPRAQLVAGGRVLREGDDAVATAAAAIAEGAIVAVKGAGGFVLAVDATLEGAVARLRRRKRRPHRPFAVMARSLAEIARIGVLDDTVRDLVQSPVRPIVLVRARGGLLAPSVAPGLLDVGAYLPPTPLQALLLGDGPPLQVMTSGNLAEEPIARTNEEAFGRLAEIADLFLVHDREIHARADDSVVRPSSRGVIPIRRARGIVPETIELPVVGPPVLAVGGHERSTVCLVHEGRAVLSQHIGDLDHPHTEAFFREAIEHLQALAGAAPVAVAHDLHPDYRSTRWALASGLPRIAVQHHHAHVASCLAEHGRCERVIGIAFDGTGLGDDGGLWGGEILDADLETARRRGHLRALALAGGEAAIRSPWRLAAAALLDAGEPLDLLPDVAAADRMRVCALLGTGLAARATGAGRWFDAVAALLGVGGDVSYDGQAAAQLEACAASDDAPALPLRITDGDPFEIDLRPTVRELSAEIRRGAPRSLLAARFHMTLAVAIREACRRTDGRTVVLTGGCFQNRRLLQDASTLLEADGFEVLAHHRVPPGDGGLALGQAAVASFRLLRGARHVLGHPG